MFVNDMANLVSKKINYAQKEAEKEIHLWENLVELGYHIENKTKKSIRGYDYVIKSDLIGFKKYNEYYQQFFNEEEKVRENIGEKIKLKEKVRENIIDKSHIDDKKKELYNSDYIRAVSIKNQASTYALFMSSTISQHLAEMMSNFNEELNKKRAEKKNKISNTERSANDKKQNMQVLVTIISGAVYVILMLLFIVEAFFGEGKLLSTIFAILGTIFIFVPFSGLVFFIITLIINKIFGFVFSIIRKQSTAKIESSINEELALLKQQENNIKNEIELIQDVKAYQKQGESNKVVELIQNRLIAKPPES